ncbi:DUF779 domain-containing protein [Nitrospirillum sp. BR 11752]|uniref:DUF779 domain-containing protein n=1 Tax=Nitrospirillum sp. BR 11752 TaxID=3104293 RepID=UPI002E9AD147|nr:DUF779 domain-containing protein [Nitrospirillum sp. BR 11752]
MVVDGDVLLGEIGGSPQQGEGRSEYWKHTRLIIDPVTGRGGMFSLEGLRILTRSRLFKDAGR